MRLARVDVHVGNVEGGLDEKVSGIDAAPDRDLAQAFTLALKLMENDVYIVVHEKATVDFEGASGAGAGKPETTFPVY